MYFGSKFAKPWDLGIGCKHLIADGAAYTSIRNIWALIGEYSRGQKRKTEKTANGRIHCRTLAEGYSAGKCTSEYRISGPEGGAAGTVGGFVG